MIVCYLSAGQWSSYTTTRDQGQNISSILWNFSASDSDELFRLSSMSRPCTILEREKNSVESPDNYRALLDLTDGSKLEINGIPRYAIEFVDRPYCFDQLLENAFRHEIEIHDDIFPSVWMDLEHFSDSDVQDGTPFVEGIEINPPYDHCRYFMAESSIPDAGIGIYTGSHLNIGDQTQPDIAIHIHDYEIQRDLRCERDRSKCSSKRWLPTSYVSLVYISSILGYRPA